MKPDATNAPIDLIRRSIKKRGSFKIQAFGDSMRPFIAQGDCLVIETCTPDALIPRDIIAYSLNGRIIAHRLVKVQKSGNDTMFYTKGDHVMQLDNPVTEHQIVVGVSRVRKVDNNSKWIKNLNALNVFLSRIQMRLYKRMKKTLPYEILSSSRYYGSMKDRMYDVFIFVTNPSTAIL